MDLELLHSKFPGGIQTLVHGLLYMKSVIQVKLYPG